MKHQAIIMKKMKGKKSNEHQRYENEFEIYILVK